MSFFTVNLVEYIRTYPNRGRTGTSQQNVALTLPDINTHDQSFRRKHEKQMSSLAFLLLREWQKDQSEEMASNELSPRELLECKYLRLSDSNVQRLESLCREAGMAVDIHPHSHINDVAAVVFGNKSETTH